MPTSTARLNLTPATNTVPPPPPPPASWRRMSRQDSVTAKVPPTPPPPPPPPPPLPAAAEAMDAPPLPKRDLNPHVVKKLENLKKTPRKRPDWAAMMKEIESGKKLRRVETNDRSKPILPKAKAKGKVLHGQKLPTWSNDQSDGELTTVFVYESEQPTLHNQLLAEIQRGVRLKKAKCNDRSRPNIKGLGTFRRQLSTVEDPQANNSEPTTPLIEPEEDYDDIDKVRDDLQSTKQLLEIELKTKIKLDEENAKLQAEIRKLKEELAKKPTLPVAPAPSTASVVAPLSVSEPISLRKSSSRLYVPKKPKEKEDSEDDEEDFGELDAVEEELNNLRGQAELARKTAEDFEMRYKETAQKLVLTQANMEDTEQKVLVLEKKLKKALQHNKGVTIPDFTDVATQTDIDMNHFTLESTHLRPMKSQSKRDLRRQISRQDSRGSNLSSASLALDDGDDDDMDDDGDGSEDVTDINKPLKRELALLQSRLRSTKDKERNTRNERYALKQQLRKLRNDLKDERKRYGQLQKEVDGMAVLMNETAEGEKVEIIVEEVEVTDSEDEEEEAEEQQEDVEEDDDLGIEEVEEVESEDDSDSDEMDTRIMKLNERIRNHDNVLNTLKKGNYLLKSRVDKFQDELRNEREKYTALELELNTCLAELG